RFVHCQNFFNHVCPVSSRPGWRFPARLAIRGKIRRISSGMLPAARRFREGKLDSAAHPETQVVRACKSRAAERHLDEGREPFVERAIVAETECTESSQTRAPGDVRALDPHTATQALADEFRERHGGSCRVSLGSACCVRELQECPKQRRKNPPP